MTVVMTMGCGEAGPTTPEGLAPPAPEATQLVIRATGDELGLVRDAVTDLRLHVFPALERLEGYAELQRRASRVEAALVRGDGGTLRTALTDLARLLDDLGEGHPALHADIEVVRLTIAASDDVVVPARDGPAASAHPRLDLW